MSFDLNTAVPVVDTLEGARTSSFDLSTARPISAVKNRQTAFEEFKKNPAGVLLEGFKQASEPFVTGIAKIATAPGGIEGDVTMNAIKSFFRQEFATEEQMEAHPVARTVGILGGSIAPFIATAPLFPQTLIGTTALFGLVGGASEFGRQEIVDELDAVELVKETGKNMAFGPVWRYANSLKFVSQPIKSALARSGVKGAGVTTVSAVFGDDVEEALKHGGLIMALSLIFEAPPLAKTALGRQIVKEGGKRIEGVLKAKGLSEPEIRANAPTINIDRLDAFSTQQSLLKLMKAYHNIIRTPIQKAQNPTPNQARAKALTGEVDNSINKMAEVAKRTAQTERVPKTFEELSRDIIRPTSPGIVIDIPKQTKNFLSEKLRSDIEQFEKIEGKRIPALDRSKMELKNINATIKVIREQPEFSAQGEHIFPEKNEILKDLIQQKAYMQEKIGELRPETITRTKANDFKQRVRDIEKGVREGRMDERMQIKEFQKDVENFIKDLKLEAKDKAKFLSSIKRANTPTALIKEIDAIQERADRLFEASQKRNIASEINKNLERTKPVKVGTKSVGKFDLEKNRFFEDIRSFNKMSKEEAAEALSLRPSDAEGLSVSEIIKNRFLSLKANGMESSLQIYEQVLSDIKQMIALGAQAKSDEDFIKLLDRVKDKEDISKGIENSRTKKDTFASSLEGFYIRGLGNTYSMLNTIAGKPIAERFDPEPARIDKNTAVFQKTKEIMEKASKILGLPSPEHIIRKKVDMRDEKFDLTDTSGITIKVNRSQILDIYNSIKNGLIKNRYYNAFGEEQIEDILTNLTPQEMELADYGMEVVQSYYPVLNQRSIDTRGRDLGRVKEYWPSTSERAAEIYDDIIMQSETPSAMKARSESAKIIPKPVDFFNKINRHIAQAEHARHLSPRYEELMRIFTDKRIKTQITDKYGEGVYRDLIEQIKESSMQTYVERGDIVTNLIGKGINNWVVAKIAFGETVFFRQLGSAILFAEKMPIGIWSGGFASGIKNPSNTFNFMWKNAPWLEERFHKGFKEALREAIESAEAMNVAWNDWTTFLTAFVRSGDIGAIIYGGFPLVQHEISKGMAQGLSKTQATKAAFEVFKRQAVKTQQSGTEEGRSRFQNNKSPIARIFLAFKNTPSQFIRRQVDAIVDFRNGDIGAEQLAKTSFLFSVLMPSFYVLLGLAAKELGFKAFGALSRGEDPEFTDSDEILESIFIEIMKNPFNAIPLIDDIVEDAIRRSIGAKTFRPSVNFIGDSNLYRTLSLIGKDDVTGKDIINGLVFPAEVGTGFPASRILRWVDSFEGSGRKRRKPKK